MLLLWLLVADHAVSCPAGSLLSINLAIQAEDDLRKAEENRRKEAVKKSPANMLARPHLATAGAQLRMVHTAIGGATTQKQLIKQMGVGKLPTSCSYR